MFEQLRGAVGELRSLVGELEPDCFDGPGARTLVELFDEVERLGAAGKALATRQVVATGAWKHDGAHRDAASWLAGTTGSTVGAARATVDTAARVAELPATETALRAGTLSLTQVEAIADAATADPGCGGRAPRTRRARRCAWSPHRVRPGEGGRVHRRSRAVRPHPCGTIGAWVDRSRRHRPHRHPRPRRRHRQDHGRTRTVRTSTVQRSAHRRSTRALRCARVRRPRRTRQRGTIDRRRHRRTVGHDRRARRLRRAAPRAHAVGRGVRDRRWWSDPRVGGATHDGGLVPQGAARRRHRRAPRLASRPQHSRPVAHRPRRAPPGVRHRGLPRHPPPRDRPQPPRRRTRAHRALEPRVASAAITTTRSTGTSGGSSASPAACTSSPRTSGSHRPDAENSSAPFGTNPRATSGLRCTRRG